VLPWTVAPVFVAPIAGALSDRVGGHPLIVAGLALQAAALAWMAAVTTPEVGYTSLVGPFIVAGIGMALFFAPVANVILGSVRPEEEGQASGANNAIRELGGVFGVAVLASVFSGHGGYGSPQTFVDGLTPAVWLGAIVVAIGALLALGIPRLRGAEAPVEELVLERA
jgi:MFS family permease